MLEFFKSLVLAELPGLSFSELLNMLIAPVMTGTALHKQAFHSLAKCVAALAITVQREALPVVEKFLKELKTNKDDAHQVFALFVIGEFFFLLSITTV
jgi:hypothetical protein